MEHMQHQVDEHQHLIEYLAIDQQEQITQLLIQLLHLLQKSLIQTVTAPSTGYYKFSWKRTDNLFAGATVDTQMKLKKNGSTFIG
jgi:hypothetical protein